MSIEPGPRPQNEFGSLQGCFVEGNLEQRARQRRIRRHALVISIAAQSAILTAIILIPLFGKPERIAFAMTPIPPYFHNNVPERERTETRPINQRRRSLFDNVFRQPPRIPDRIDESPDPAS